MKVHILDTIKLFLLVKYWIKNKLYKKYCVFFFLKVINNIHFPEFFFYFQSFRTSFAKTCECLGKNKKFWKMNIINDLQNNEPRRRIFNEIKKIIIIIIIALAIPHLLFDVELLFEGLESPVAGHGVLRRALQGVAVVGVQGGVGGASGGI